MFSSVKSLDLGNSFVLVLALKVLLPRKTFTSGFTLKLPRPIGPEQTCMISQPTLLLEQVLDQKEHRLDGHSMNPKKAIAMKNDPVKKIFVGGLIPEATEEKDKGVLWQVWGGECLPRV